MKLLYGLEQPETYRGGFVSIGNFDGVHLGHQQIASRLVQRARDAGLPAVVFTFHPHPITLLRPHQAPPSLCTVEHKAERLGQCGVDVTIAYPTDMSLLNLTPQVFFSEIVQGKLDARGLVEGPNFFFGKDRSGSIETLRSLCESSDLSLDVVDPVVVGTKTVSSSVIRRLIQEGTLDEAVKLLGHAYRVQGRVCEGSRRGQSLGFPTANLDSVSVLLPGDGVYAGRALARGTWHPAAINVGPNPTFGEDRRKLEVHLVGFSGDLYGDEMNVDFISRLRDTQTFEGVEELRRQLERDIAGARELVDNHQGQEES